MGGYLYIYIYLLFFSPSSFFPLCDDTQDEFLKRRINAVHPVERRSSVTEMETIWTGVKVKEKKKKREDKIE